MRLITHSGWGLTGFSIDPEDSLGKATKELLKLQPVDVALGWSWNTTGLGGVYKGVGILLGSREIEPGNDARIGDRVGDEEMLS
jgi:hypothetical protein